MERRRAAYPAGRVEQGRYAVGASEGYLDVVAVAALDGRPRAVSAGGRELLALRLPDGTVVVTDRACPHQGQPLTRGRVEGRRLECAHHCYVYDLDDGACVWPGDADDRRLTVHETRIRGGRVEIRLAAG